MAQPADRSHILAESRNPRTMNLHELTVAELVDTFQREDAYVLDAVRSAAPALARFLADTEPRFLAGGRLIYFGAGTSGRLGVLDASEAPPTFCLEEGRIIGIIAGGDAALRKSSEGREDEPDGAHAALAQLHLSANDTILGIAAGGTTPYVLGAFPFAKSLSHPPLTAMLSCSPIPSPNACDHLIIAPTGPEVLTGSTRLKAATATKLILNTISTTLMVRSGRVYENLMVDVRASNAKLRDRAARIVSQLTGLSRDQSFSLLDRAGGSVKTAVLMSRTGLDREDAEARLLRVAGKLSDALGVLG